MALELILRLQKSAHLVALYLERFRTDFGVTQPEAQVLASLTARRARSIGELQRRLGLKPSTLTSVLDRLAARGFIVREPRADDRRSFDVRLTPAGAPAAAAVRRALEALETKLRQRAKRTDIRGVQQIASTLEELLRRP